MRTQLSHLVMLTLFQIIIRMLRNFWVPLPHHQQLRKIFLLAFLSSAPSMSRTKNTPVIIPGCVFVGSLGREVGEDQLEEIFTIFGMVEKVVVVRKTD